MVKFGILMVLLVDIMMGAAQDIGRGRPLNRDLKRKEDSLPEQHDPQITGGTPAKRGQFPYLVAIYPNIGGHIYFCSGSLISRRYVLTAAYCVSNASDFEVVLGSLDPSNEADTDRVSVLLDASAAIIHPTFLFRILLDNIALLRLPEDIELSDVVQTIALPNKAVDDNNVTFQNAQATISGWGTPANDVLHVSKYQNYAHSPVMPTWDCVVTYMSHASYPVIPPLELCTAGSYGTKFCSGDTGSPVVVGESPQVQIGIVSNGGTYCENGYPTVITRVSSYLDFIQENSDVQIQ